MLRITLATLLSAGLLAAALACSSGQTASPATPVPAQAESGVAQTQARDSTTAAPPATDAPPQNASTATPSAPASETPATQASSPTAQAQTPAAPTDTATAAPAATAEPTAAASAIPTATAPSPTDTLPPPTEAPTAAPATPRPAAPEGTNVGETPPTFAMNRVDGTPVASADLAMAGRPVFMHYFATWWPTCRAELRTLAPIITEYAGQVVFYLVSFNESADTLESYVQQNGYQNITTTQPVGSMLRDLKITSQSSMLAMDAHSVITFRKGYGRGGDEQTLRAAFQRLTQQ